MSIKDGIKIGFGIYLGLSVAYVFDKLVSKGLDCITSEHGDNNSSAKAETDTEEK